MQKLKGAEMTMGNYKLNGQTLLYINKLGSTLPEGNIYTTADIVERFKKSEYYSGIIETFSENAVTKAISYAVTRSEKWNRIKKVFYQVSSKSLKSNDLEKLETSQVIMDFDVAEDVFGNREYKRESNYCILENVSFVF
jgi:hypothetical protein